MKVINIILSFLKAALKNVDWILIAVNFIVIFFYLVFKYKGWAIVYAAIICVIMTVLYYSVSFFFKKKS